MRLFLIRHGQTPANVLGLLDTAHPGPGLTELGRLQAERLADNFATEPLDALYTSTLIRTHLTAAPLSASRGLHPEQLPGVHEIQAGALELRSDPASVRTYLETVSAWVQGERDVAMPGGADGHEFFGRYTADVDAVASSGAGSAAIISHGAAIRVWVAAHASNLSHSFVAGSELGNTAVVELSGTPHTGWRVVSWDGAAAGGDSLTDRAADDPIADALPEAT